ncbi:hypothetical protein G9A89_008285 [Geosiphon pyriformis]|nr:hypothetical protein G9A89_008285 [Geosiphon pyriformis]
MPVLWRRAWVLMISKSYDWDGILMNTCPIALIEMARKILSKILSDRISFTCSKFGVLRKGLSKPSLAKAYSDVHFFTNVVLRKTITDKQFLYLMLAVLQPIVTYHTQFSFVSLNVCHKWNVLVRKGLKLKTCLPHDFPDVALHHPSLYGLKSFKQIQTESKLAAVVMFSNTSDILGHLFDHRFLDWTPLDLLQFSIKLHEFSDLHSSLHELWSGPFEIFTDGSLKDFGSSGVTGGIAAYFSAIDHSIGIRICGLMSFTLAELQAVALALECVPSSNAVKVHLDS